MCCVPGHAWKKKIFRLFYDTTRQPTAHNFPFSVNDKIKKTVYLISNIWKKQVEYELLVIFLGACSVWRLTAMPWWFMNDFSSFSAYVFYIRYVVSVEVNRNAWVTAYMQVVVVTQYLRFSVVRRFSCIFTMENFSNNFLLTETKSDRRGTAASGMQDLRVDCRVDSWQ